MNWLSAGEFEKLLRAAMEPVDRPKRDAVADWWGNGARPAAVLGGVNHPDWCMYCDRVVESRYMRWDFGMYKCRECVEGLPNPVALGILSPNEARAMPPSPPSGSCISNEHIEHSREYVGHQAQEA